MQTALRSILHHPVSPRTGAKAVARMLALLSAASILSVVPASAQIAGTYTVTNIISDGSVPAATVDANFINPWAASASPNWWISAQGTGFNYVVAPAGTIPFKVIVPAASGLTTATGLPAGSVTTAGTTGMILPNGTKASFIFSTLDGTISGWNSKLGTANAISQIVVNKAGASYPGLAIVNTATTSFLLAANFGAGNGIDVFDSNFQPAKLAGSFTDPSLPANYAPFSIHVIGSQVFVAYAVRTAAAPFRSVNALGNGIVSIFDTTGNFVARAVTGGNLNSPWGVAIAPTGFGVFGGSLLIGNFGNGLINAYDPKTFAYRGQLSDGTGKPLTYASLWELLPGATTVGNTTTVSAGDPNTVYFTAGLTGEVHGLFASIANNPTATGTPTFGFSSSAATASVAAGSSATAIISVAPTNNFSGTVTLACSSGLPTGATCNFSPAQLTVSPSSSATATLTIQTTKASAALQPGFFNKHGVAGISYALLLPFASVLLFVRRRSGVASNSKSNLPRLLGVAMLLIASAGFVTGCSSYTAPTPTPSTPAGVSNITVLATSGTITQQISVALTVQ
ncbi:hypothetical protein BH10ACI4_BH10ACI4_19260 [soil metagenome]